MFKDFEGIERFQVIQKEITSITIKLVCNDKFSDADKEMIRAEINKYDNGSLDVVFDIVDEIPLTKAGKHKVTICEI